MIIFEIAIYLLLSAGLTLFLLYLPDMWEDAKKWRGFWDEEEEEERGERAA